MPSKIFFRDPSGTLATLEEGGYATEDELQQILAESPEVLLGEEIAPGDPVRWLLVSREAGIADGEGRSTRWAVDHLFLDHRGVVTLVEVKRASNPQIRREVVGQLLEYAANASFTWTGETLRAAVEAACGGSDPEAVLAERLGVTDPEAFWAAVEDNLRLGRLRLLFVADRIPPELQRVVEFLNEQMDRLEVLAVEIRQFAGGGHQSLVPRVLGRTSAAEGAKRKGAPRRSRPWTAEELVAALRALGQPEDVPIIERILVWAEEEGLEVIGGSGAQYGSLYLAWEGGGDRLRPFYVYGASPRAYLHLWLDEMGETFAMAEARRAELCARINGIVAAGASPENHYPGIAFGWLDDPAVLESVLRELSWALGLMRAEG